MSEPVKIIVTAQAAAALQSFVKDTGGGLKTMAKTGEHAAASLGNTRLAMMELGHVGRAVAEELAMGMSPLRILELEGPRIVQSLAEMGIGFARLVPWIAGVGAAVGLGYLGWKEYMSGVEDSTKATADMVATLDKLPALLEKINNLKKAGLISPAAAKEFSDYLGKTPKKQLYRHADGSIDSNEYATEQKFYRTGDPFKDQTTYGAPVAGKQLTPAEASDYVSKQALPQVSEKQTEAGEQAQRTGRSGARGIIAGFGKGKGGHPRPL
jgi:hypothetical protein